MFNANIDKEAKGDYQKNKKLMGSVETVSLWVIWKAWGTDSVLIKKEPSTALCKENYDCQADLARWRGKYSS